VNRESRETDLSAIRKGEEPKISISKSLLAARCSHLYRLAKERFCMQAKG